MNQKEREKLIMQSEPAEGGCFAILIGILVMVFAGMVAVTIFQVIKSLI
jgi:hypothetical protein